MDDENCKIAVWGPPTSGKTTLSKMLGRITGISNIIHTDDYYFTPTWKTRPKDKFIQLVQPFLNKSTWIVDGNLGEYISREYILEEADQIIILNRSLPILALRVIRRTIIDLLRYANLIEPLKSMENLSFIEIWKITLLQLKLIKNFKKSYISYLKKIITSMDCKAKTLTITNQKQIDFLLFNLKNASIT
ncbi:MAG: hypothetical protein ACXAD7_00360 [Candidatus Kariarchaeaceae archaeon]